MAYLALLDGDGTGFADLVCEFPARCHELVTGDHLVDQPDGKGFLTTDPLSSENQFFGLALAHDARQALGAPGPGNDGQARLRQPHGGIIRGDADVAGQGQFGTPAQGNAVYRGDDRLVQLFNGGKQAADGEDIFLDLGRRQ